MSTHHNINREIPGEIIRLTTPGSLFEGALIETLEQLIDCRIELGEGEKVR